MLRSVLQSRGGPPLRSMAMPGTRRSLVSATPAATRRRWRRNTAAAVGAALAAGAAGCGCARAARAEAEPTVALRAPHALYVWGSNDGCTVPQSGLDGTPAYGVSEAGGARGVPARGRVPVVERPQPVPFFDDKGVRAVAFAAQHAAAVDTAGKLYVWGAAHQATPPATPAARAAAADPVEVASAGTVTQIACSDSATYALTDAGEVVAVPVATGGSVTPQPVAWSPDVRMRGDKVVKIAAGDAHVAVLTASGQLFCLEEPGWAWAKPLLASAPKAQLARVRGGVLEADPPIADVACGASHLLARTADGRVVGLGSDKWYQLGQGVPGSSIEHHSVPVELEWTGRPRGRAVHICAGGDTSFVTVEREDPDVEQVYTCGFGSYGTLGTGVRTHAQPSLMKIPLLSDKRYYDEVLGSHKAVRTGLSLTAGAGHAVAAQVPIPEMPADWFCWGANALAQRGAGKKRNDGVAPAVAGWGLPGKLPLLRPPARPRGWFGGGDGGADGGGDPEATVVCDRDNTAFFAQS